MASLHSKRHHYRRCQKVRTGGRSAKTIVIVFLMFFAGFVFGEKPGKGELAFRSHQTQFKRPRVGVDLLHRESERAQKSKTVRQCKREQETESEREETQREMEGERREERRGERGERGEREIEAFL